MTGNAFKNSVQIWRLAGAGVGFHSRLLAFLCARLGNLSEKRTALRAILYNCIGCFARKGQIATAIRIGCQPVVIWLRKDNLSDYLVFGELVMGGYKLPDRLKFCPSSVLDGGANIGLFSIFANAKFPGINVTCYEPDQDNLVQLHRNLAANKIAAEVVPKALWSKAAELFFHPSDSYNGFVNMEPSPYPISCVLPVLPGQCWLKLDIEGAEYEVLPALLEAGRKPDIISMEIHDYNQRGQRLLSLLKAHGYEWKELFQPTDQCVTICALKHRPDH